MILDKVNYPADIKKLSLVELEELAREIRHYMLQVVSETGGHLASSLGAVELTIALHYVFNTPEDKIIWDVGHQAYSHKILTGRKEKFKTIRRFGGLSGFPKRKESPYDSYDVGHSSTSISLAVGEAAGRDLLQRDYKIVAVIGDGSLTGGMAFEGLNHLGHIGKDVIVVLNDNEQSISENVGALSRYLTEMISGSLYNTFRKKSMKFVKGIPIIGKPIFEFAYRAIASFKNFIIPGQLFEDMGLRYFGPVDGHNLSELIKIFDRVKDINSGPKLVHVLTKKGRGFVHAETDPCTFHGTGPFDIETGHSKKKGGEESFSSVVGRTLAHIAKLDDTVVAVTAAMKEGTGLAVFEDVAPDRLFDVGIAEQHAVTFSAAMASSGLKPFVSIYSTFYQRAYDQIIHDVAIMNLPVRFLIDRAGIVGDDGETHHGLFDISMFRNVPNIEFFAPSNGEELRNAIYYAWNRNDGPTAIRYPRGSSLTIGLDVTKAGSFFPGKAKILSKGKDVAIIAVGDMLGVAIKTEEILKAKGIEATVINLLSIKPLDTETIIEAIKSCRGFITMENGYINGGIGEHIYSLLPAELCVKRLFACGFPDVFVTHGTFDELLREYKLDHSSVAQRIEESLRDR
ncbi:MAG: 1-deoxy-D-xylulose-5-phosphate synthase [Spirochaetes bacterium ADurb.Bin218]|nr:MAG: 1-deoxy-D-xylulose-5-phosphate synthase [Spirochaetes bacterium ADurb.Bin218]